MMAPDVGSALKRLLAFTLALAAAQCVSYQAKPISLEKSARDFEARRLDDPELKAYLQKRAGIAEWPPRTWDLKSLTLAAWYYHPDLDAVRARWAAAEAGTITAGARPNPSLSALLGYDSTSPTAVMSRWIPELALDIPVETAGKRGIRMGQAAHLSEAARLDVLTTAWEVRTRLRRALVDVCTSQESEALLATQASLKTESVHLLDVQQAAGELSSYEASQARIALDALRLAILEAGRRREEARARLADAVGVPLEALVEGFACGIEYTATGDVNKRWPMYLRPSCQEFQRAPDAPPTDAMLQRALTNRTDILGALAEYEASQSALQLEIAKQYPDIHLGAGYQFDQTDNKWTLGLSLELPMPNRNQGPIAEAEARRAEAAARLLALQAHISGRMEVIIAASRTAAEKFHAADSLLSNLHKREETARANYELGEISKLEYIGMRLETASAELARLQALNEIQQAAGDLEEALQGPLDSKDWILETPDRGPTPAKEIGNE